MTTLRIERRRSGDTLIVQLIGEFDVEHLDEVNAQVNGAPCPVVVDIGELTLISVEGIRSLNACHHNGMSIINASGYIAEWMTLEGRSKLRRQ
jgi:anti-anti-sigma regulatory factor